MVVIAILVLIMGVGIPSLAGLLALQQRGAVQELATSFVYLRDEATLRNVTFRLAFNLDRHVYAIEAGSPDAVIFSSSEERIEWEQDVQERLSRYTERELEEGAATELMDQTGRFAGLDDVTLDSKVELPGGSRFGWIWTPQYEEPVYPAEEPPEDPEDDQIVYAYIFPNGQMEHAVIRIVSDDDPADGWTLIIEPLTGRIHLEDEEIDPLDLNEWLPEEGPEMPQ